MADTIDQLRAALSNAGQKVKTVHKSGVFIHIIFWFTLIFHLIPFDVNSEVTGMRFGIYVFLALFVWLFHFKKAIIWVAAALEIFFPYLLLKANSFVPGLGMEIVMLMWLTMPAFAVVLSYLTGGKFFAVWLDVWVILLVFMIFKNTVGYVLFPSVVGQLNFAEAAENVFDEVINSVAFVWEKIAKGFKQVPLVIKRQVDYVTGGYYTGMVEDQQGEPVGLYIDRIRLANDRYFEGQPVFLWVDIKGKSFKDRIKVETGCYSNQGQEGVTNPVSFDVVIEGFESVSCMFPDSGDDALTPGRHNIEFNAAFNFETWSYVTYTFVSQQTLLNFLSQDKNINKDLNIDKALRPIYTPGPVSIGMSSDVPQPVGVSDVRGLKSSFGVTLNNLWTDGEILDVSKFIVLIPSVFTLEGCDAERKMYDDEFLENECVENPDDCPDFDLMDAYSFVNFGAPSTYKSITCRLEADSVEDVIPIGQHKAQHTFVVIAKYDYRLTKSKSVEVIALNEIN